MRLGNRSRGSESSPCSSAARSQADGSIPRTVCRILLNLAESSGRLKDSCDSADGSRTDDPMTRDILFGDGVEPTTRWLGGCAGGSRAGDSMAREVVVMGVTPTTQLRVGYH